MQKRSEEESRGALVALIELQRMLLDLLDKMVEGFSSNSNIRTGRDTGSQMTSGAESETMREEPEETRNSSSSLPDQDFVFPLPRQKNDGPFGYEIYSGMYEAIYSGMYETIRQFVVSDEGQEWAERWLCDPNEGPAFLAIESAIEGLAERQHHG